MSLTTDPKDPELGRGVDTAQVPQHKKYLVLSEEDRAKGFVAPVRRSYVHDKCGVETKMGLALCETYARDPKFYGSTYCVGCKMHLPVGEFKWSEDGEVVGSIPNPPKEQERHDPENKECPQNCPFILKDEGVCIGGNGHRVGTHYCTCHTPDTQETKQTPDFVYKQGEDVYKNMQSEGMEDYCCGDMEEHKGEDCNIYWRELYKGLDLEFAHRQEKHEEEIARLRKELSARDEYWKAKETGKSSDCHEHENQAVEAKLRKVREEIVSSIIENDRKTVPYLEEDILTILNKHLKEWY